MSPLGVTSPSQRFTVFHLTTRCHDDRQHFPTLLLQRYISRSLPVGSGRVVKTKISAWSVAFSMTSHLQGARPVEWKFSVRIWVVGTREAEQAVRIASVQNAVNKMLPEKGSSADRLLLPVSPIGVVHPAVHRLRWVEMWCTAQVQLELGGSYDYCFQRWKYRLHNHVLYVEGCSWKCCVLYYLHSYIFVVFAVGRGVSAGWL